MVPTGRPAAPTDRRLTLERFQRALVTRQSEQYSLTLFVSGASELSASAIANVREICDAHLAGRHDLKIVDLHQEPELARQHHVLATPTLIRDLPLPRRILVGDMSDHPRILLALDLLPAASTEPDAQRFFSGERGT